MHITSTRDFAKFLKKHRKTYKMTQAEFADMLYFDRTYIGAIERGERANLTLKKFLKLLSDLNLNLYIKENKTEL